MQIEIETCKNKHKNKKQYSNNEKERKEFFRSRLAAHLENMERKGGRRGEDAK